MAIDLNLFRIITEEKSGFNAVRLAQRSGCTVNLLIRLLRPLSTLGFVQEAAENVWIPCDHTSYVPSTYRGCTYPFVSFSNRYCLEKRLLKYNRWDQGTTTAINMPKYFKKTGYCQPEDPRNGLFQDSMGTHLEAFEYWSFQPDVIRNLNTYIAGIRGSRPSWIEWWPVEERILADNPDRDPTKVLLVDVAGGRGHDVQAFGRKFQAYVGRLILQDLPALIEDIQELDGRIERVGYDFSTLQPIIGKHSLFSFLLEYRHD